MKVASGFVTIAVCISIFELLSAAHTAVGGPKCQPILDALKAEIETDLESEILILEALKCRKLHEPADTYQILVRYTKFWLDRLFTITQTA